MEVLIYNPQTKQREGHVPEQVSGSWIAKLSEDAYTLAEADLCTKHEYFENVDHPKTICWIVGGADGKPRADATVLWYIDQTVAGRRQCCRAHKETVDDLLYRDILQLIGGKLPETLAESDCQRIEAVGEWLGYRFQHLGWPDWVPIENRNISVSNDHGSSSGESDTGSNTDSDSEDSVVSNSDNGRSTPGGRLSTISEQ